MKQTLSIIIFFLSLTSLQATVRIEIEILNTDGEELLVYPPVEGAFFYGARYFQKTDSLGRISIEFESTEPGFCYIFSQLNFPKTSWNGIQLFIVPNSNYTIKIDKKSPIGSLEVKGKHSELNKFLNQRIRVFLNYPEYKHLKNSYLSTKVASEIFSRISAAESAELELLSKINTESDDVKKYVEADIKYFYKTIFSALCTQEGFRGDSKKPISSDWVSLINQQFLVKTAGDKYDKSSMWFPSYLDFKFTYFVTVNEAELMVKYKKLSRPDQIWSVINEVLAASEIETKIAAELNMQIDKYKFEENTIEFYEKFKNQYPNSKFLKYLSPAIKPGLDFHKKESTEIKINDKAYQSLSEVLEDTKQDYVFIDLWASWCRPCKEEFTKADALKNFIENNGDFFELIYISVDKAGKRLIIEHAINFYNLKGRHILTNEKLTDDLLEKFGNNGQFMLPTYVIMKKDGTILNKDASRPSNWALLKKELEKALENRK